MHLKLGELLIQQGLITEDQLKEAMKAQKRESGRIGEVLMKLGILSEEELAKALGAQLNIPFATLENNLLQPDFQQGLDKIVPYDFAKANFVLPIKKNNNNLTCAVADPLDLLMLDNLKMVTGQEINLLIATRAELMTAIQEFYAYMRSTAVHGSIGAPGTVPASATKIA